MCVIKILHVESALWVYGGQEEKKQQNKGKVTRARLGSLSQKKGYWALGICNPHGILPEISLCFFPPTLRNCLLFWNWRSSHSSISKWGSYINSEAIFTFVALPGTPYSPVSRPMPVYNIPQLKCVFKLKWIPWLSTICTFEPRVSLPCPSILSLRSHTIAHRHPFLKSHEKRMHIIII